MRLNSEKNGWSLFLILLAGIVIGSFIGHYLADVPYAGWLAYGNVFGVDQPFGLELGIFKIWLGLTLRINVAGVIGLLLAVILYRRTL